MKGFDLEQAMKGVQPFNLYKALSGHPLITRDGRTVTDFKEREVEFDYDDELTYYPFCAMIGNEMSTFTRWGGGAFSGEECCTDLFLLDEEQYNVVEDMRQAGLDVHVKEMYEQLQSSWKHIFQIYNASIKYDEDMQKMHQAPTEVFLLGETARRHFQTFKDLLRDIEPIAKGLGIINEEK